MIHDGPGLGQALPVSDRLTNMVLWDAAARSGQAAAASAQENWTSATKWFEQNKPIVIGVLGAAALLIFLRSK